jgi:hypothetical protein
MHSREARHPAAKTRAAVRRRTIAWDERGMPEIWIIRHDFQDSYQGTHFRRADRVAFEFRADPAQRPRRLTARRTVPSLTMPEGIF